MSYSLFDDYLGLSSVAWNSDLKLQLNRLMSPPRCHPASEEASNDSCSSSSSSGSECSSPVNQMYDGVLFDGFQSFDPLDMIRSDAHEDFINNGVEASMDDYDVYQSTLREQMKHRSSLYRVGHGERRRQEKKKKDKKEKKGCVFCKNNGESVTLYSSHVLKDKAGNVACPILRKYTCPKCGVNGDKAHTIRYCPKL